jgi:2-polyprenyl-3-methyl-5-hydroxy-6-metoxy-1,4-benzoquinol methylase
MSVKTCPACGSARLATYPVSRRSQRQNFRCQDCRLAGWSGRDELPPMRPVGLDVISVEERSAWFALKRAGVVDSAWREVLDKVTAILGGTAGRTIYDVGAGDGHFLTVARERGFTVGGNELLEAAIEIARDQYDIELDLGDLAELDIAESYDAITLWCVLAHVPEPSRLLEDSFRVLRPGGVMYLQTPHRCAMDSAALGLLTATRGRASRWVDRRIAQHHWFLHSRRSMVAALERAGFTDVRIEPKARYSLQAAPYLQSLGLKGRKGEVVGRSIDGLLDRGLAPRIVLDVYARKPESPAQPAAAPDSATTVA